MQLSFLLAGLEIASYKNELSEREICIGGCWLIKYYKTKGGAQLNA